MRECVIRGTPSVGSAHENASSTVTSCAISSTVHGMGGEAAAAGRKIVASKSLPIDRCGDFWLRGGVGLVPSPLPRLRAARRGAGDACPRLTPAPPNVQKEERWLTSFEANRNGHQCVFRVFLPIASRMTGTVRPGSTSGDEHHCRPLRRRPFDRASRPRASEGGLKTARLRRGFA